MHLKSGAGGKIPLVVAVIQHVLLLFLESLLWYIWLAMILHVIWSHFLVLLLIIANFLASSLIYSSLPSLHKVH